MKRIFNTYPRLEAELDKRMLNSNHIALALGVSYWSANRKRNGTTKWTEKEKSMLAHYFGVGEKELFER